MLENPPIDFVSLNISLFGWNYPFNNISVMEHSADSSIKFNFPCGGGVGGGACTFVRMNFR